MLSMTEANSNATPSARKSWRDDAVRIVEELFPATKPECWDLLIDLRQHLVRGDDWNRTLDVFLSCRERLEAEQYLPFYRLRRLMAGSLRLEAGSRHTSLKQVLLKNHRSLADIRRAVSRELFEHDLTASIDAPLDLRVVEL